MLRGCRLVVTFDDENREIPGGDVIVAGDRIEAVGVGLSTGDCDRVIDGSSLVVLPGLINSHHHLYQGAARSMPALERAAIGEWLRDLGRSVKGWWEAGTFDPDVVRDVAAAVLTESVLGGVTTVADQHYFYPRGPSLPYAEATVEAAAQVGVRLHVCRGTITDGPDQETMQAVDEVMRHCERLITACHDSRPGARTRVALAPCGVHVDRLELFDQMAELAADHERVRLHTHLYEHVDTEAAEARYGKTPWQLLCEHGWAQERTWLAHMVDVPPDELAVMASAGVAVSHLPAPDLKMGWGAAPVREMIDAGIPVGLGTTGCASNDGSDLLGDARLAHLASRVRDPNPERWLSAREVLSAATRGSARCLGRDDLGVLAAGYQADIAAWDFSTVDRIGIGDPVVGLVTTGLDRRAALVAVAGEVVIEGGRPTGLDVERIASTAHRTLQKLVL